MILTNLTLTDFGVFHGQHSIALAPRPSRPVVLFGGKNGAGKSTLLEAIRVCLYGQGAFGGLLSKEAYLTCLESRIHSNPNLLIQPTFAAVALEFQYAESGTVHSYLVTRSWERRGARKLIEQLEVKRNGQALDDVAAEHWQDFVRGLIPAGVSQLFFFDGEKIQQLAEDTSDQQTLADSIKSLLGIDIVERLQTDLGIYLSRLTKPLQDTQRAREVEEMGKEITRLREWLEETRTWAAAGFKDTELGVWMKPEVTYGATTIYARVQAGGGEADHGTRGDGRASRARFGRTWNGAAPMDAGACRRSAAGLSGPGADET